jgi:hypothetical protein
MEGSIPYLLTLNCHEAWVHQLGYLDCKLDIIDGLPGRYCNKWDMNVRPIPKGARLVTLGEVLESRPAYDCVIAHNITDLLDLKTLPGPRILVIHNTLDGRIRQHGLNMPPETLRSLLFNYLDLLGGHGVAVSTLKGRSWGMTDDIVTLGVDVKRYLPWSGELAAGLRVSNQIASRKEILLWDYHEAAFEGMDIRLVGFNPDMVGVTPSRSWDDLKSILSAHRFFVHTAHPELEDGYNMATLEAMASGLPILGNRHPTSPVEHGVSGFLCDDPRELRHYAEILLRDRELAGKMGEEARKRAAERFPMAGFAERFKRSIEIAKAKWKGRKLPDAYFSRQPFNNGEELTLLIKNGRFIALGEIFRNCLRFDDMDGAAAILDEMMELLEMPRNGCISSLGEMEKVIIDVSDRLMGLRDHRSAELLLKTMGILPTCQARA